jgi:hypothetical protein
MERKSVFILSLSLIFVHIVNSEMNEESSGITAAQTKKLKQNQREGKSKLLFINKDGKLKHIFDLKFLYFLLILLKCKDQPNFLLKIWSRILKSALFHFRFVSK